MPPAAIHYLAAGVAIGGAAWVPIRLARPQRLGAGPADSAIDSSAPERRVARSPFTAVGAVLRGVARRPADPGADRYVGRVAVVAGVVVLLGSPTLSVLLLWGAFGWRIWWVRAQVRRRERATVDLLPDLIDLFRVAVSAGCTPPDALVAVAGKGPEAARPALHASLAAHRRGASLAEAVGLLPVRLGAPALPLAAGLARSLRDGSPLLATLDRLSDEARQARRRQAEIRARQLPVRLLFPLVLCTLPAFALLTVVPLLLTSLQSLRL